MAEVIERLHNLPGSNLGEIFRTLNLFIRTHTEEIRINLNYILVNFIPRNQMEQVVKIRLIDQYQCYDEMLNILKSEDSFYISHSLQCGWFFENSNFDPNFFVNSIFPCMSLSTRSKVLKKYSKLLKNTELAEALFKLVKHRYGFKSALTLLPACSENFIRQILDHQTIKIPVFILIPILNLFPEVVIDYVAYLLEAHSKKIRVAQSINIFVYEQLFSLIASKAPVKFSRLVERYSDVFPYMKIGKRATKRLLHSSYDSVKNHVNKYKSIIVWKNIPGSLRLDELSDLQLAAFPQSAPEFLRDFSEYCLYMDIIKNIKNGELKKRLLFSNFQKAYGEPITEYLNILKNNLLDHLPINIGESWAEMKLKDVDDIKLQGLYITYLPAKKAMPEIQKMIEVQPDVHLRTDLIVGLFKVVTRENDPSLIGPLCKYVVKRFRNERAQVKEKIIKELANYDNILDISEDAWVPIDELCNIMLLTEEANFCDYDFIKLLSKQIHFRLIRGLPVCDKLNKLMEVTKGNYDFDICRNTPYERQCLEWFLQWFLNKKFDDTNVRSDNFQKLLQRICSWNEGHPKFKIEIPPWMKNEIVDMFAPDEFLYRKTLILRTLRKDNMRRALYDKIFPNFIDPTLLCYKLRQEPLSIKDNHSIILNKLLGQDMRTFTLFLLKARLYTSFNIPEVFSEYCNLILTENEDEQISYQHKRNAITILSMMLSADKYKEIIANYYPKQNIVDDFSDEGKEIFEVQKAIASSFKWIAKSSEVIDSVRKFAVGDYLKLIVSSVTCISMQTPEYKILPILKSWLDCPVSVRKHFIRAYFHIAPIQSTVEMVVEMIENETNLSIRLLIIEHSIRFFVSEPCAETFAVLKAVIEKLKSSDEPAIDKLCELENIPNEFLSDYVKAFWDKLNFENENVTKKKRNRFIIFIGSEILDFLSEEVCDTLISHVFNQDEAFPLEMKEFVADYLLCSKTNKHLDYRLRKVYPGIEQLVKQLNQYNLKRDNVFLNRITLSLFVDALARRSSKSHEFLIFEDLLSMLKQKLLTICKEEDILEELIYLEIVGFLCSSSNTSQIIVDFPNFVRPIVEKLVDLYGNAIIDIVSKVIYNALKWKTGDFDTVLIQLSELFLSGSSHDIQLLGIKLLPTDIKSNPDKYNNILRSAIENSNVKIKPHINKLCKELTYFSSFFDHT